MICVLTYDLFGLGETAELSPGKKIFFFFAFSWGYRSQSKKVTPPVNCTARTRMKYV